jgi:hypothetical protein
MAGTGGRQVTGENGKNPSDRKVCYVMVMEGFGLRDNCRIIADSTTSGQSGLSTFDQSQGIGFSPCPEFGIYKWPLFFPWPTIIMWCWSGVLKLSSSKVSGV